MYRTRKKGWLKHIDFILLDVIMMELALFIAIAVRFSGAILFIDKPEHYILYQNLSMVLILVDLVGVFFFESYDGILSRTRYQELTATIIHSILNFGGGLLYMYVIKQSVYSSRGVFALWGILMVVLSYMGRVILKIIVRQRLLRDIKKRMMIIVSESGSVENCLSEIAHDKYTEFKVSGVVVVDKDLTGTTIQGIPVIASADTFLEYVRTNVVDEVLLDGNTRASQEALASQLVELGVTVHISLFHASSAMPNRIVERYGNFYVMTTSMHIANNRQIILKRLMDIVGSIVGLIIFVLAFIVVAPIIKLTSPGPVFFSQIRIGENGRKFKIYKFRSMYVDAEAKKAELLAQNEMQGNMFKMENDPRITPVGRIIRKLSIDELPQFWNVLKGDMSLVGTRPPTEDEYENYAYHHKARLSIKPGLTGMWQVSGRNKVTDFEEVVALDTEYISNWSLGLDCKIIFKTIGVVLSAKGS